MKTPSEEEVEIRDRLYQWYEEGIARRVNNTPIKCHPGSLRGMLDIAGWVQTDLMLALCRSNESYRECQRSASPDLFDEKGNVKT